uniref:Putative ovule protein n=1 Tax=Solanum chacoense TaxID=4108 RepID=A0A0V0H975_SOLCH
MLGVPSNNGPRLSGATINTFAMIPSCSNFSSTGGALKLRTNSPYSVMSRFKRKPPLGLKVNFCQWLSNPLCKRLPSSVRKACC